MNKFLKIALLNLVLVIIVIPFSVAQDGNSSVPAKPKKPWTDNLFFGGGIGANFGNNQTYLSISPIIGYRITERLSTGIGLSYTYYNAKRNVDIYSSTTGQYLGSTTVKIETNNYGGSVFARYLVTDEIFIHTEFENLNAEVIDDITVDEVTYTRINVPAFFVGGGYTQRLGGNSAIFIMALWDIIEDRNTPYQNPIIRIGVNVGF